MKEGRRGDWSGDFLVAGLGEASLRLEFFRPIVTPENRRLKVAAPLRPQEVEIASLVRLQDAFEVEPAVAS